MEIVRTFHPVGQGAFYSERFFDDVNKESVYNIVYDCGVEWGYITKAKHVVSQSFSKNENIDILFLSHLDYDHISLVETLISAVGRIKHIVMPFMVEDDIIIMMALMKISNQDNAVTFLQSIIEHLHNTNLNDDYNIIQVIDPEYQNGEGYNRNSTRIWRNGDRKETDITPDWIFIPYNFRNTTRKKEFKHNLEDLFNNNVFVNELTALGFSGIHSGKDLFDELKNEKFVAKVLNNPVLRNGIKKAYNMVEGGINENSLLLYSGPATLDNKYCFVRYSNWGSCCCSWFFETGCLYTGDSIFELSRWEGCFSALWENIGTIQLPHHGSLKSFDIMTNPIDRHYIFPVSCGSVNKYGHPSGGVLAYLLVNDCRPYIVTEMAHTVYSQVIRRR